MPATDQRIRVLIVDDHPLFCEGLTRMLEAEEDMRVVGSCTTVEEALKAGSQHEIDIVLLDVDLGHSNGQAFLDHAHLLTGTPKVIVLTAGISSREAVRLTATGACGLFMKSGEPQNLIANIRAVARTGEMISPMTPPEHSTRESEVRRLTPRECDVLRCVYAGMATKQIAAKFKCTETAIKSTLQHLFNKAGVRTRAQLVLVALEKYPSVLEKW
jgi:two-component system nitrate/nitrite response regulator NarL